jgi:predicted phosphodiesterase
MTTLAILADIHGNLPALEAVIADMQPFAPDHVIVAGDLINGAPFSAEVMARVHALRWTALRGNHEFFLLDGDSDKYSPLPAYLAAVLRGWHAYIAAMPDALTLHYDDAPPIRVFHGLPTTNRDAITMLTPENEVREMLATVEEPVYISGHYHLAVERRVDDWYILNPGPVGMSQDGIRTANYMLLRAVDGVWVPQFRRVPYNFERVAAAFDDQRLIERLGMIALLYREQLRRASPMINAFYAWYDQHHTDDAQTLALARTFLALDDPFPYFRESYQVNRHLGQNT